MAQGHGITQSTELARSPAYLLCKSIRQHLPGESANAYNMKTRAWSDHPVGYEGENGHSLSLLIREPTNLLHCHYTRL